MLSRKRLLKRLMQAVSSVAVSDLSRISGWEVSPTRTKMEFSCNDLKVLSC
jgi:hypothetical protein